MKNQTEYVTHTFAPVFDSSSRVLLLGTMPSPKSERKDFITGIPETDSGK